MTRQRLQDAADRWVDLDPVLTPSEALWRLLEERTQVERRDVRAGGLQVSNGRLVVAGESLPYRPWPAYQLRRLAGRALGFAPQSGTDLNRGLRARRDLLVRIDDGEVIAILGRQFKPFDDAEMAGSVGRALRTTCLHRRLVVRAVASGSITVLRFTCPRAGVEATGRDRYEPGFDVRNSEVGCAAFAVVPIVYRRACGNTASGDIHSGGVRVPHTRADSDLMSQLGAAMLAALGSAKAMVDDWRVLSELREHDGVFDDANRLTARAKTVLRTCGRLRAEARGHMLVRSRARRQVELGAEPSS